jgi:hypothetical protein
VGKILLTLEHGLKTDATVEGCSGSFVKAPSAAVAFKSIVAELSEFSTLDGFSGGTVGIIPAYCLIPFI